MAEAMRPAKSSLFPKSDVAIGSLPSSRALSSRRLGLAASDRSSESLFAASVSAGVSVEPACASDDGVVGDDGAAGDEFSI